MTKSARHDWSPDWDHAGFLRVAWEVLRTRPFAAAVPRVRRASLRGVEHATLTLAWLRLVDAGLAHADEAAREDLDAFLAGHPHLRDPDHVLVHYSPARIGSARARREFVLPDRAPLPRSARHDLEGRDSVRTA
ncbi:MAG: hypothetical protein ACQGVC_19765 [Myxococcota bacterium]